MRELRSEGFRRAVRTEAQYLRRLVETRAKIGKPRRLRTTYSSVHAPEFVAAIRATFPGFVVSTEARGKAVAVTIAEPDEKPATVAESQPLADAPCR